MACPASSGPKTARGSCWCRRIPKDEDDGEGEKDADNDETHKTPEPIVIDRYHFKRDRVGYLDDRYQRIYVFDVATKKATLLTPGGFDSTGPAWSPDGKRSRSPANARVTPTGIATPISTSLKLVKARSLCSSPHGKVQTPRPVFSPDGTKIAYLQGGMPKYSGYDPAQLAVVSVSGGEPVLPPRSSTETCRRPAGRKTARSCTFCSPTTGSKSSPRCQPKAARSSGTSHRSPASCDRSKWEPRAPSAS